MKVRYLQLVFIEVAVLNKQAVQFLLQKELLSK